MKSIRQADIALTVLVFLQLVTASQHASAQTNLLRIRVHGKIGFIDTMGKVVIAPRFANVGAFHDGVAPAREGGTFGYIDETGRFVIPPIYDFATEFHEGFGITYVDGKPSYIGHDGKKPFEICFAHVNSFERSRAIVRTASGHEGAIDRNGKLVVDTIYAAIRQFIYGAAIAIDSGSTGPSQFQTLIDTNGKVIRALLKNQFCEEHGDGWLIVNEIGEKDDDSSHAYLVGFDGVVRFARAGVGLSVPRLHFTEGVSAFPTRPFDFNRSYKGFIDSTGRILSRDSRYVAVSEFHDGHAIALRDDDTSEIIDYGGRMTSELPIEAQFFGSDLEMMSFDHGLIVVPDEKFPQWRSGHSAVVDTNGRVLLGFSDSNYSRTSNPRYIHYYFGPATESALHAVSDLHEGIVDLVTGKATPPFMDWLPDDELSTPTVLFVRQHGKVCYTRYDGTIIWRSEDSDARSDDVLDIDHLSRGRYEPLCPPLDHRPVPRLWSGGTVIQSAVKPLTITEINAGWPAKRDGTANVSVGETEPVADRSCSGIALVVSPNDTVMCRDALVAANGSDSAVRVIGRGLRIVLSNCSRDTLRVFGYGGRFPQMWIEALGRSGTWIELDGGPPAQGYVSQKDVLMHPFTRFVMKGPLYTGSLRTRFRVGASIVDDNNGTSHTVYSNEFEGSANPAQLWRNMNYGSDRCVLLETEQGETGMY